MKHYAMKAYRSGCIDPHCLDLGTSLRWVVNFTPLPLYPRGKSPRYPLDRRLGGPQSQSGRLGEENSRPFRDSNSEPSVVQPVASRYNIHKVTWTSADGRTHNQIDHILIDRRRCSHILDVRSFRAADCDTDRYLLLAKIGKGWQWVNKQHTEFTWSFSISRNEVR
jgi:hypothetical protein